MTLPSEAVLAAGPSRGGDLALFPLLKDLDAAALQDLAREAEWFDLPGGSILFEFGAAADALYLVSYGCLGVLRPDPERAGAGELVAEIAAGETVGEMAMITGAPRSATVVALRDSKLVRLNRRAFETLTERHPKSMLSMLRLIVQRLERTTRGETRAFTRKTLTLLPLSPGVPITQVAEDFRQALERGGRRAVRLDEASAQQPTEWLHAAEESNDIVIYQAETSMSPWTKLCLRQGDRVVLVGRSSDPPTAQMLIQAEIIGSRRRRYDLLLLQDGGARQATQSVNWLSGIANYCPYRSFHMQVRMGHAADYDRLARYMTGQAVGLVLGGGGARGFAHLGVIKAMHQAGIPIDLVGGTSMGAIVGSGVALDWDDQIVSDIMREAFVSSNPVNDYTLPVIALIRGRKVSSRLREIFGDLQIEDMWLPFFAIACNLTKGATEVQRTGPLWRALRATVALPGVMPPVVVNGEVLVDGGVINNLPADEMGKLARGPVIGVDVAKDPAVKCDDESLEDLSLWAMLRRGKRNRPSILNVLMRSGTVSSAAQSQLGRSHANLVLTPELEDIDMLDWQAFDTVIERGYRCAMEALERGHGKLF